MVSLTGDLLTGPFLRPDFDISGNRVCFNKMNEWGWLPGFSTLSGSRRAFWGIVHAIYHFAKAIFDLQHQEHLREGVLGLYSIARGIVESVPLIGNLICFIYDHNRGLKAFYASPDSADGFYGKRDFPPNIDTNEINQLTGIRGANNL